jgi:alkylation response protein AidB-like acyl-CoA dehydrogenase
MRIRTILSFTSICSSFLLTGLPRIIKERLHLAVAMSEPELGSDLASLATTAKRAEDGKGGWVLNGRKMWISAGSTADLVIISAVTDAKAKAHGISLFVVEKGMEGFEAAKRFAKLGKHASDTSLLTLVNVRVPDTHLIGKLGEGFIYMMRNLPKERLCIAVGSMAAARRALATTMNYGESRTNRIGASLLLREWD